MAIFGLNQAEIQSGYDAARKSPYDPERDSAVGWTEGALAAPIGGIQQGFVEAALPFVGDETQKTMLSSDVMNPSPETNGWLANVLQGVGSVLPAAVGGTAAAFGNPIGGALAVGEVKGYAKIKELENQGIDPNTAATVGAIEGITQGAGVLLPAGVGGKLSTRLASGAGINVGVGVGQRGLTAKTLEDNGYKDMASQYKMLDSAAIFTDAILGSFFGAMHGEGARVEPLPSQVDAALAANNLHQLELDSAPGVPIDAATRNAHVDAMNLGMEQLLRGEPVDISGVMNDANFINRPLNPEVDAAYRELLDEEGIRPILSPEARMAELERGLDIQGLKPEEQAAIKQQMDALAEEAINARKMPEPSPINELSAKVESMSDEMRSQRLEMLNKKMEAAIITPKEMIERDALNEYGKPKKEAVKPLTPQEQLVESSKRIAVEKPDLMVMTDAGEGVKASELLMRADKDIAQAEKDSRLFDEAINCFMRFGQ